MPRPTGTGALCRVTDTVPDRSTSRLRDAEPPGASCVLKVTVDSDGVSVGDVAGLSSPQDTLNRTESKTTPPAGFIVLTSVMAEANQENRRTRELSRVGNVHAMNAALERRRK